MEKCIFCDREANKEEILAESRHFFVKNPVAVFAPGHVVIVSKAHIDLYGVMPPELKKEFIDFYKKVVKAVATEFSRPRVFEHGKKYRTIEHMHLHVVPSKTNFGYIPPLRKIVRDVPDKKIKLGDISFFRDNPYNSLLFEEEDVFVYGLDKEANFRPLLASFLNVPGIKSWKEMDEKTREMDEVLRKETAKRFKM